MSVEIARLKFTFRPLKQIRPQSGGDRLIVKRVGQVGAVLP